MGSSGSGKSLLLKTISLLHPASQGSIHFRGKTIIPKNVLDFRAKVIYLHQSPHFFPGTARDNFKKVLSFKSHEKTKFSQDFLAASLETLDLSQAILEKDITKLSGGQKQMIHLLRALVVKPNILMLDEASANLDSQGTQRMEKLVNLWLKQEEGRATIWITHQASQRKKIANRHLLLENKRLVETNTLEKPAELS